MVAVAVPACSYVASETEKFLECIEDPRGRCALSKLSGMAHYNGCSRADGSPAADELLEGETS